jgi:hypothetical protein
LTGAAFFAGAFFRGTAFFAGAFLAGVAERADEVLRPVAFARAFFTALRAVVLLAAI